MNEHEPAAFLIVDSPKQLKAFTDPLRTRVLDILVDRAATNQQVAQALGEPQAKVLHHIRVLLNCGLIRLVDMRVSGGNVEKYYRAVARSFGLRPKAKMARGVLGTMTESVRQEVAASLAQWPEQRGFEIRKARLSNERVREFQQRLLSLLSEFWDDPTSHEADVPVQAFAAFTYRDPSEEA